IVMTSNLGAEILVNQPEGQDTDAVKDQVMAIVRASFRPEFLNRVDEIILFHRLKRGEMGRIVDIQIARLGKPLEDRQSTLQPDNAARDWLADKGYDPAYGARPLKRVIQKSLQDPLAEMILAGSVKDGETVAISAGKQGLSFNGKAVAAAAELLTPPHALGASTSPFQGRLEQAACSCFAMKDLTCGELFPRPEMGRDRVGVTTARCRRPAPWRRALAP